MLLDCAEDNYGCGIVMPIAGQKHAALFKKKSCVIQ